ncbi:hypothetical protein MCAP1_003310 [Malassezia caprae]|uniref:Uncharacterized protein n=1 Tax=Malassezia caprae TaxID=1381934 RepID=A0AAF0IWQ1_9BASI|nr:hypothetical protein MCAP1_003310 [Malassezia caprae]
MTYRGAWDGLPTSSSSPPLQATLPSSPPSSPTPYERTSSTSVLAFDPFSASAKSLSIGPPSRPRWSRAATAPGRGAADGVPGSLNVLPCAQPSAPNVLGEFFESQSDASMSSVDELGSSYEVPTTSIIPARRAFERTESASTDPLSAAGRTESFSHAAQRLRFSDASPKKGASAAPAAAPEPPPPADVSRAELQWDALVNRIFDEARARPALLLGGYGLESVPSVVGDLRHYVAIEPRRAGARTSSQVTNSNQVQLYLWDNHLTRLPSALFQVTNLGVLSLRKNHLTHLPAAIGDLRHLRELNVGGNALSYLPAEIQQLQLHTFTYVPNPFLQIPPDALLDVRPLYGAAPPPTRAPVRWARAHTDAGVMQRAPAPSAPLMARTLGALERGAMPSLADLCVQRLLSDDPLLIEQYETGCLRALQHTLTASTVAKIEAARRSATASWGTRADLGHARPMRWYEDAPLSARAPSALDVDTALEQLDDACDNVWFQRCPGAHERGAAGGAAAACSDWPGRPAGPLFVRAAETRIEWVSHVAGD